MKFSKFVTSQNLRTVFRGTAFMPFYSKIYTGHMATNDCSTHARFLENPSLTVDMIVG